MELVSLSQFSRRGNRVREVTFEKVEAWGYSFQVS